MHDSWDAVYVCSFCFNFLFAHFSSLGSNDLFIDSSLCGEPSTFTSQKFYTGKGSNMNWCDISVFSICF